MIHFSKKSEFPVGVDTLFDWHERPGAFGRLAPPWQNVRLLKHVGGIQDGAEVHVQTKVGGIAQTWKIRHEAYVLGERFVDVLESGPFSTWRHEHLFSAGEQENTSLLNDDLAVKPLGGAIGYFFQQGLLKEELKSVFNYRHSLLREDLKRASELGPLAFHGKVLITGVTGMIGKALAAYLQTRGYQVLGVSRSGQGPWPGLNAIHWDPSRGSIDVSALNDIDVVINLAGESILGPWSQNKMRKIRESREQAANTLIRGFETLGQWPKVWINASGSGFYGPKTKEAVDESSPSGGGFLAHVCRAWEDALQPIRDQTRVVSARLGTVMSPAGGALSIMLPIFKFGGGGILGDPRAHMPWIGLDDVVYGLEYLLYHDVTGPVNFVSPEKLNQEQLSKTLARVLKRPAFIPAPAGLLKTTLGSMAKEVFLIDQKVEPTVLGKSGYTFSYPNFEKLLIQNLGIR